MSGQVGAASRDPRRAGAATQRGVRQVDEALLVFEQFAPCGLARLGGEGRGEVFKAVPHFAVAK
jgi:hypothetical protein